MTVRYSMNNVRKFFHTVHLWLSIPVGLLISVICLSGAALVFEKEITELCNRDLYYADRIGEKALPVDCLANKVAQSLPDSVKVTGITAFSDPRKTWQVSLSQPHRASIYIDPYTGEIKGRYERPAFFTAMFKLHRWLLHSRPAGDGFFLGKQIVGVTTLLFVVILLSGLVVWIPRRRKALKNRLCINVRKGGHRAWYDLHVAGGFYAAAFLLVMALTGLTWSFPWYRSAFYTLFGVRTEQSVSHGDKEKVNDPASEEINRRNGRKKEGKASNPFHQWPRVYDSLVEANPGYRQITIAPGSANVSFDRLGNQRASDRYSFHPGSGEITGKKLYTDQDTAGTIRGWIYSVHVGSWGGLFTRILSFLASLIGGLLPLTGYYLWLKKVSKKRS